MGPTVNSTKCCIIPLSSSNKILESFSSATIFGSSCKEAKVDCSWPGWDPKGLTNLESGRAREFTVGIKDEVGF